METCYYHPEAKAKATCPECTMPICDVCRLEGDMTRCAACAAFFAEGGMQAEATVPAMGAGGAGHVEYEQPMCTNHATLAADMQCLNCFRPFCLSCASTGYCPDCAPQFVSKQGAAQHIGAGVSPPPPMPQEEYGYQPAFEEPYQDPFQNTLGGFDLAASYLDEGAPAPEAPPRPPRKRPADTGGLKKGAPAKGAKKPVKKGGGSNLPIGPILGGLALVGALAGGGYWYMGLPAAEPDAQAPVKVTIISPKGSTVSGQQVIKLKVVSPDLVEKVELTIDGKYWGRFKEPPFESDWPTSLIPNGKHKVNAKVFYEDGRTAVDKHEYTVKNKL